jgi:hypothetical protein
MLRIIILSLFLLGCSKPTSGVITHKIHDPEKKIIMRFGSGPDSISIVPEAYWLVLDTGRVLVSSNQWHSVKIGDQYP